MKLCQALCFFLSYCLNVRLLGCMHELHGVTVAPLLLEVKNRAAQRYKLLCIVDIHSVYVQATVAVWVIF